MTKIGILVCQSEEVLQHKLEDGKEADEKYCYWEFSRFPRIIREAIQISREAAYDGRYSGSARLFDGYYDEDDLVFEGFIVRLYFAVKGMVRGWFVSRACNKEMTELRFHSEDWFPLKKEVKIKPSQGFRYVRENDTRFEGKE